MKHNTAHGVLLALAAGSTLADEICTTHYASTSVSSVPTHTKSITTTSTQTEYYATNAVYNTTTTFINFTYLTVYGNTTITLPTGTSFTPIISAPTNHPTGPHPPSNPHNSARNAPSSPPSSPPSSSSPKPSYPISVDCTTATLTRSTTTTTYYTPTYSSTVFSTRQFHTSTLVPTKTAYAACETPARNLITKFHGYPINFVGALAYRNLCDPSQGASAQAACANPKQCCEAIQAEGDEGFAWTTNATGIGPYTGIACLGLVEWDFDTGRKLKNGEKPWFIGNGPSGSGVFGSVA